MNARTATGFLLLLTCLAGAAGQDPSFSASAPASVRAGEQFEYVIEGSGQGEVILPSMEGFQLLAGPFSTYSSHSQWINGRMTMKTVVTYTHVFRTLQQGSFTIPPSTVRVGRKSYKTNEVTIQVVGSNQSPPSPASGAEGESAAASTGESSDTPVFLRIIPSRREVYVGEQLVSGLKVHTRVNTRPASTSKDVPYEGFYKKTLDPDANARQESINGQQYITQVIQRHILIPQKPGNLVIKPFESDWMIQKRVQRRSSNSIFDDFFEDPFFNSYQDVPVTLATRPVTILVKPLPPGAPGGFNGAVGDFSMSASLSSEHTEINEALSMKITIRGAGNLPLLGEPEVHLPPDHDVYDVVKSLNISTAGNRISGSVTFEYPIVARHAGRFRIPPILFAWFDPASGNYRTQTTEEFVFTVEKGESDGTTTPAMIPGVFQENVENLGTDIRDIHRELPPFMPLAKTLLGTGWYQWLYPLLVLLAVFMVILIRLVAKRNADLSLVRNRQASKSARARLKKADRLRRNGDESGFYEEIGKAIWGYLSDKLNMETSEISREVILDHLNKREVPEAMQSEFLRILEDSEFSRFAPSSEKSDMAGLYNDAATLIRNLENNL